MQAKICFTIIEGLYLFNKFLSMIFHATHDVFALVISFYKRDWKPKQITIGLFEALKTT